MYTRLSIAVFRVGMNASTNQMQLRCRKGVFMCHLRTLPQLGGFVLLRNTWEPLRNHYSQFFDWVGIYSLEVSWRQGLQ